MSDFFYAFYQIFLHPIFGNSCKFYPSCSKYGSEAFKKFSPPKATALTLWRVLRCHPFTHGGFDPIPEKSEVNCGRK